MDIVWFLNDMPTSFFLNCSNMLSFDKRFVVYYPGFTDSLAVIFRLPCHCLGWLEVQCWDCLL